ncbi:MAG: GTPase HflX, partial [Candidatus Caldarchaeum sp.]
MMAVSWFVEGKRLRVAVVQRLDEWGEYNIDELKELCRSVGYEPVYSLVQRRPPHPKYQIGPGKVEELRRAVERLEVEKVVFENELKPVQEYNLAKALSVPVISRTQLILETFAHRAASSEAKLQIKLAELRYELSRAKEKVRLAKRGEQPGFHGLGAYEADVYYNEVFRRISVIKEKLKALRIRKTISRKRRSETGIPSVALTGYTNAGKTTLFNLLAGENSPAGPQLFTTLSTTSRIVSFNGRKAYLSDTVGFIRNLPHLLVESFHSTLSEFIYA